MVEHYGVEVAVGVSDQAGAPNQVGGMFACQLVVDSKACRSPPFGVGSRCSAFDDCGCGAACFVTVRVGWNLLVW